MVAPGRSLGKRLAAELGAEDDQRVVEEAPGLQVAQQSRNRPVDCSGDRRQLVVDVRVVVPVVLRSRPRRSTPAQTALPARAISAPADIGVRSPSCAGSSSPYMLCVAGVSLARSSASGADCCIRAASS